jgi:hypothetical protein
MKTKLIRLHLPAALIFGSLLGCGKSPEANEAVKPVPQPTSAKQQAVVLPPTPQTTPMKPDVQPLPPIADLSPKVSGVRIGTHGRDAVVAMHQLLQQWSPVGRRVADVKAMLGTPSEESAARLVYRFDDGDQAYEWTLAMANGAITSVSKVLHE